MFKSQKYYRNFYSSKSICFSVMTKFTEEKHGMNWGLTRALEDLDYRDDEGLLRSFLYPRSVSKVLVDFHINVDETKSLRIDTNITNTFQIPRLVNGRG